MPTDFETQVIADLAVLKSAVQGVHERLDRMNGSVSHLFDDTQRLRVDLTEHPIQCPNVEKLRTLDRALLTGEHPGSKAVNERIVVLENWKTSTTTETRTAKKLLDRMWPLIYAVGGAILLLLLTHIDTWLGKYVIKP